MSNLPNSKTLESVMLEHQQANTLLNKDTLAYTKEETQALQAMKQDIIGLSNNNPEQLKHHIQALENISLNKKLVQQLFQQELDNLTSQQLDISTIPQEELNAYHQETGKLYTDYQQQQQTIINQTKNDTYHIYNTVSLQHPQITHQTKLTSSQPTSTQYHTETKPYTNPTQTPNHGTDISHPTHKPSTSQTEAYHNHKEQLPIQAQIDLYVEKTRDEVKQIQKQLRFMKRGEGPQVRKMVRHINNWLDDKVLKRLKKYEKYHKKFDTNYIKPEHELAMWHKIHATLENGKNYLSQGITGDLDEANRYFPPNFFPDAGPYFGDMKPKQKEVPSDPYSREYYNSQLCADNRIILGKGSLSERFASHGILGAIDKGVETIGAGETMRSRLYQVGNAAWGIAKIGFVAYNGRNLLKSAFNRITGKTKTVGKGDKAKEVGYFGDVVKHGALLAGGFVLGPSINNMIQGGETSQWAAQLINKNFGGVPTAPDSMTTTTSSQPDNHNNTINQSPLQLSSQDQEKLKFELSMQTCMKLFEHTTWSDWNHFLGTDGKIDFEKYKDFIIKKEGLHSPILKLLTEQQTAWPTIQNFVAGPLGIGAAYIAGKMKFNPHEKFEVAIEELKRETDDVAESYDKKDQAQIKPQLDTILSTMEHNQDPQYALLKDNLYEVERELNILHTKHPQARPITIEYDNINKKIRINTYQQSNFLTFNGTEVGITSPYNDTMWKTSNINEAIRIANLTNALTSSSYQFVKGSTEAQPYHISALKDLEYLKQHQWDALKELNRKNPKDTSVLQDSIWSPRFEELYPSIEHNKEAFAQWLNNFTYKGQSLWKKDS